MITPQQSAEIKSALERVNARRPLYKRFYDYYEGRHTWNFSSKKFKDKYGQRLQELRENLCRTVVKAPASRLEVIGFAAEKEEIKDAAWKIWKRGNMPLNSSTVHREAYRTGDAYMIVWPGPDNKARMHAQRSGNITVWKNGETGEIEKAAKQWTSGKRTYLTLYYPDRIEKYISKEQTQKDSHPTTEKDFEPRAVDGEAFPLPNPYKKVPVYQFTFDSELDDHGQSLLTDVIPLNDALNKSYADIFVAQEYNSMRQRYVSGIRAEEDEETATKIEPYKADDATWIAEDPETKFGQFPDSDLESMLKVKGETVRDIALVSGIPPSYFNLETSDFPSGEALRKIEARFTAIIQDSQRSFGETWGKVMAFALEIEGGTAAEIEAQWSDAAPVSETEQLDNAMKKKNLGWSIAQIQRDFGLTDKQIADMATENAKVAKEQMENAAKFFDGGAPLE